MLSWFPSHVSCPDPLVRVVPPGDHVHVFTACLHSFATRSRAGSQSEVCGLHVQLYVGERPWAGLRPVQIILKKTTGRANLAFPPGTPAAYKVPRQHRESQVTNPAQATVRQTGSASWRAGGRSLLVVCSDLLGW